MSVIRRPTTTLCIDINGMLMRVQVILVMGLSSVTQGLNVTTLPVNPVH